MNNATERTMFELPPPALTATKSEAQTWAPYEAAYLRNNTEGRLADDASEKEEIEAWNEHVKNVGLTLALQHFWLWQASLPKRDRSDVDPYDTEYTQGEVFGWSPADRARIDAEFRHYAHQQACSDADAEMGLGR